MFGPYFAVSRNRWNHIFNADAPLFGKSRNLSSMNMSVNDVILKYILADIEMVRTYSQTSCPTEPGTSHLMGPAFSMLKTSTAITGSEGIMSDYDLGEAHKLPHLWAYSSSNKHSVSFPEVKIYLVYIPCD